MIRRVVAAVAAVVLAAIGILLVVNYANRADERALEGMETQDVLIATEPIEAGAEVGSIGERVEVREVPRAFLVDGAISDLDQLDGQLTTAALAPGEQLQRGRFSTPENLRARGEVELPEEAADLHQVTVALEKSRALGGNVTAGDTVGVFMSFEVSGVEGYLLQPDGTIVRQAAAGDSEEGADAQGGDSTAQISTTHLTLNKVLVARVEGGFVAAPEDAEQDTQGAEDTISVTLALEAPQAEQLVFAMEFGQVWLSLEPETADEDGTGVVVVTIPDEGRNVYQ